MKQRKAQPPLKLFVGTLNPLTDTSCVLSVTGSQVFQRLWVQSQTWRDRHMAAD